MFISLFILFIVFLLPLYTQIHNMIVIMNNVWFYNFGHEWVEYPLVTFNTWSLPLSYMLSPYWTAAYHYVNHSQICCFALCSIVYILVLQSQNCFHVWDFECTSEKSSLRMNIPVRKCEVLVYLCQFFPVVSDVASNINIFHGIVPKLKTVTTCVDVLSRCLVHIWHLFYGNCSVACENVGKSGLQMWRGKCHAISCVFLWFLAVSCDFMCLVLFPHGEVPIFMWKKSINYERM